VIYFQPNLQILPAAQRELWAKLAPVQELGYVLYEGTAIGGSRYGLALEQFRVCDMVIPHAVSGHLN
jgi:hypothetical protein